MGPGAILDGTYRLDERIGSGGSGDVYRATHLGLGRSVAVKVLRPGARGPEFFLRFRQQAEALGRLSHPAIVSATDFGVDPAGDGTPYLAMSLVTGRTLLEVRPELGESDLDRVLRDVAAALDHAHARGVVHGDLSPRNVLVGPDGAVTVIDFGVATLQGWDAAAGVRTICGTPGFAAPELYRGLAPAPASDMYSLAALAHWLVHGVEPSPDQPSDSLPPGALSTDSAARPRDAGSIAACVIRARARAAYGRWLRAAAPRRLGLAAALALAVSAIAPMTERLAMVERAGRRVLDLQQQFRPARAPDPRLLIVTIDEATLGADPRPLADRGDEAAAWIAAALNAGATVVGLDLLLPAAWGLAPGFGSLVIERADRLVLAATADESGRVVGPEAVSPPVVAALGPPRAAELFAFVAGSADDDGVTRRAAAALPDTAGQWRLTLAGRLAQAGGAPCPRAVDAAAGCAQFLPDYSVDWDRIERMSWREVAAAAAATPSRFKGRIVLVGADFVGGGDLHPLPRGGAARVPGVVLQALLTETLLAGTPVREPAGPARGATIAAAAGISAVPAAAAALLLRGAGTVAGVAFAALAGAVLGCAGAARFLGYFLPVAPIVVGWVSCLGVALGLRWSLAPVPSQ